MQELLSRTEVLARGLRWEVVVVRPAGDSALYRLRCLESALLGRSHFDVVIIDEAHHCAALGTAGDRIARRSELDAPQVLPLGLLLLVPGHAAREERSSPWRLS